MQNSRESENLRVCTFVQPSILLIIQVLLLHYLQQRHGVLNDPGFYAEHTADMPVSTDHLLWYISWRDTEVQCT
jgi:hypothetical protein